MRRPTLAILALSVLIGSCGGKDSSDGASKSSGSGLKQPTNAEAAKVAATLPQFTTPIELVIPPDNWDAASGLAAINGGPIDEEILDNRRSLHACNGRLDGLQIRNYPGFLDVMPLLEKSGYAMVRSYSVRVVRNQVTGSNPDGSPHIWRYEVEPSRFTCIVMSPQLQDHIPGGKFHEGGTIMLGKRKLTEWSFQNIYQTPAPGKGNINVYAGTFTYTIDSSLPGFSFNGPGTVKMKMWLDPDSGKWVVDQWDDQAPQLLASKPPLTAAELSRPKPPCPHPYSPCGEKCFNFEAGELCGSDGISKKR